eukprot:13089413-Alexandrium_andersonii.AAC.1
MCIRDSLPGRQVGGAPPRPKESQAAPANDRGPEPPRWHRWGRQGNAGRALQTLAPAGIADPSPATVAA